MVDVPGVQITATNPRMSRSPIDGTLTGFITVDLTVITGADYYSGPVEMTLCEDPGSWELRLLGLSPLVLRLVDRVERGGLAALVDISNAAAATVSAWRQ